MNLHGADLRTVNLTEANLSGAKLGGAILRGTDLAEANLTRAKLGGADLSGADLHRVDLRTVNLTGIDLHEANLGGANLGGANLHEANLHEADLSWANLHRANLHGANLSRADLRFDILIETNLPDADLTGCRIYGISAWDLKLEEAKQRDLVITKPDEPEITVDNIEVAQFIYLLLHNEKIRNVIDTITSKVVLILGRFTPERKAVLNALREELRRQNYLPVLFDFPETESRDLTERYLSSHGWPALLSPISPIQAASQRNWRRRPRPCSTGSAAH